MVDGSSHIILGVLNEVQRDSAATQRRIAGNLGIALGLTNTYLKRCIKKGLVKVSQAPANRYLYYLTPLGFAEKAALTAEYLSQSFGVFRTARNDCLEIIEERRRHGWRRIALAGASELAEIFALCAADGKVELVGVVDETAHGRQLAGLPVVAGLADLPAFDGVVVTVFKGAQAIHDRLATEIGADRVTAPALLGVMPSPRVAAQ